VPGAWGSEMAANLAELQGLPIASVRRYLSARGWQHVPEPGRSFDLYVLSSNNSANVELVLPPSQRSPDFGKRMMAVLRSLSQLEDRDYTQIIWDIRSIGFDTLKSRLPDHVVAHDSIVLDIATQFLQGVKRLLAATATTEINPAPFFGRVRREALDYAEHCRFGHTFRGSFGFIIESPIALNEEPTMAGIEQIPPFERRVIQRLARGLQTIKAASDRDDPSVVTQSFQTGFNANMCDDFVDLIEATTTDRVIFEFALSPEWRAPTDVGRSLSLEVKSNDVEVTRAAAKQLRQQASDLNRVIVGRVVRLRSEDDPSDLLHPTGAREVSVFWSDPEFGNVRVKVLLPPEQYLAAVEAHKNGRQVSVKGKLEKLGRSWMLIEPNDFRVL
jgi:hypothetical protein